jgi:hypothetical protein|tara:strand:- start:169 stop:384 length:216 start_codon:yes stop_codon:yes gene_type:complete
MKRIIYKASDGRVAVIVPSPKWTGTIEALAQKDVPTGTKYKIVDTSTISSDRTFRNAWEVDESLLTDGVGE